jgi:uncharacterized protein
VIEVPAERLSADVLRAVIEEFILREGTDYGSYEVSLENKIDQVRGQLSRGEVLITFDPATENCNLLTRNQFQRYQSEYEQEHKEEHQQSGPES